MIRFVGLMLFSIVLSFSAFADVSVKKTNPAKKSVIFKQSSAGEIGVGQSYSVETSSGVCSFTVTKTAGNLGLASPDGGCPAFDEIQEGTPAQSADGSSYADSGKPKKRKKDKSKGGTTHQIGAQLYYSMANSADWQFTSNGQAQQLTDTFDGGAFGLGAVYQLKTGMGLGGIAGFGYELTRKIQKVKNLSASTEGTYTNGEALSLMWLELDAAYWLGSIYGFAGVNYALPSLQNFQGASASGTLGFQLGAGYEITDMFAADLSYRTINLTVTNTVNGQSITSDYYRIWGIMVRGKVLFNLF